MRMVHVGKRANFFDTTTPTFMRHSWIYFIWDATFMFQVILDLNEGNMFIACSFGEREE